MVALVGEPGIGKSRLALEMRQRAEATGFATRLDELAVVRIGVSVSPRQPALRSCSTERRVQSTADALRGARVTADSDALDRWAAVLDDVLGEGRDDDPQLADLSPSGSAADPRPRHGRPAQSGVAAQADARRARRSPLGRSRQPRCRGGAARHRCPELRVVLLATYRSNWSHGWEGRSAYEQLNLRRAAARGRARDGGQELAAGRSVPAELTERVLERTAGNPLFLEELLHGERGRASDRAASAAGDDPRDAARPAGRAPAGPSRRTLQLASVVGMEFSEGTVVGAVGRRTPPDAMRRSATSSGSELVAPGGREPRLVFRHPLIHEVAYGSLLLSTRRALHGRIGAMDRGARRRGADRRARPALPRQRRSAKGARLPPRLAGERARR